MLTRWIIVNEFENEVSKEASKEEKTLFMRQCI